MRDIYVCNACGSRDCEESAWIGVNDDVIRGRGFDAGPCESIFCPVCDATDGIELVKLEDTEVRYYVFDADGNNTDIGTYRTIEEGIDAAIDLVLNYWPDPEIAKVCASGNDGESCAIVATVERVTTTAAVPHGRSSKYSARVRFCEGGAPRVTAKGPVAS